MADPPGIYIFEPDGFWWSGSHQAVPPTPVGLTLNPDGRTWTDNITLLTPNSDGRTWTGGVTDNGNGTWTG